MAREITSEIFQVGGAGYTASEDAAIYLICFNGKSALVDAGCGNRLDRLYKKINAIHTPGHSLGSMVFLTESDRKKVLFGQDVHGPLDPDLKSNRKDYENSLEMMLSIDADILCEGHFGIFKGKDKIRKFIQSFL